ncbi:hypothetical protein AB0C44_00745 [Micromonospora taraxaci]|uniref:hypothetical protein n=1 Tax=Micromonospora taraxaci TaxID=1316803 RepID=UPI003410C63C
MILRRGPRWGNGIKSLVSAVVGVATGILGTALTALVNVVFNAGVSMPVAVAIGAVAALIVFVGGLLGPQRQDSEQPAQGGAEPPPPETVKVERVALCSGRSGTMRLFAVTDRGAVLQRLCQQDHGWSDWTDCSLDEGKAHDVAATPTGGGRFDVFVADRRGRVWFRQHEPDGWRRWQFIDASAVIGRVVRLDAASARSGHRELYAVGEGGQVGHRWKGDDGAWSQWWDSSVGGSGDIAMTVRRAEQMEVTRLKIDGRLRQRGWVDQAWEKWYDLGWPPTGSAGVAVSALSGSRDHQEIFVVDASGRLSHRWRWNDEPWSDWYEMEAPGYLIDVAAGVTSENRLEIVVADADGRLHQRSYARKRDQWSDWQSI